MAMQKTLFRKYLRVSAVIVLVSFLLLGVMMLIFISRYWQNDKRELLSQNAENLAVLTANNVLRSGNQYYVESSRIQGFIAVFSSSIGADIFVTDRSGKTVVCSDLTSDCVHQNHTIPTEILSRALEGEYSGTGTLGGIYGNSQYIFGVPIRVENEDGIVVIGTVFTASDMSSLAGFRSDVIQMFLIASLAAFVISFLAVGLLSYNMVRPLREMAVAARCFGEGDFSRRVPVNSQDEIGQLALAFNNFCASPRKRKGKPPCC